MLCTDSASSASVGPYQLGNRRPDADDTARVGGVADRSTDVVAVSDRQHAAGDRRACAAARPPRRAAGIPGVERAPVEIVVGEPAVGERRGVAASHEDGPGLAEFLHVRAVDFGDIVLERHHAVGSGVSGLVAVDLDRGRNAMKGSQLLPVGDGAVRRVSRVEGLIGRHFDEGVQLRVDFFDARQARLYRLTRRDLSRPDAGCQLDRRTAPELVGQFCPTSPRSR